MRTNRSKIYSGNILWGAAAAAATAAFLAEIKKREEEEKKESWKRHNAYAKLYAAVMQSSRAKEAKAQAASNQRMENKMAELDALDEAKWTASQIAIAKREEALKQKRLKSFMDREHADSPVLTQNYKGPVWEPAKPKFFIGPNPNPVQPADFQANGESIFDASCEVADAIDPSSPNPEFIGTQLGWGELIDQTAISFSQTPPTPYVPFEMARQTVFALKFIKDRISTGYNIACQVINEEGPYNDMAVKIKEDVSEQWEQLSLSQKTYVVGYTISGTLLIVVPLLLFALL